MTRDTHHPQPIITTARREGEGLMTGGNIEFTDGKRPGVRGQSGTISAVVNALSKAGVELDGNGGVVPRKGVGKGR